VKTKRMFLAFGVAMAVAVGSAFAVPVAGGASPNGSVGGSCHAMGKSALANSGVVNVVVKGAEAGTPVSCAGRLTGTWAKHSTTFQVQGAGQATLAKNHR